MYEVCILSYYSKLVNDTELYPLIINLLPLIENPDMSEILIFFNLTANIPFFFENKKNLKSLMLNIMKRHEIDLYFDLIQKSFYFNILKCAFLDDSLFYLKTDDAYFQKYSYYHAVKNMNYTSVMRTFENFQKSIHFLTFLRMFNFENSLNIKILNQQLNSMFKGNELQLNSVEILRTFVDIFFQQDPEYLNQNFYFYFTKPYYEDNENIILLYDQIKMFSLQQTQEED